MSAAAEPILHAATSPDRLRPPVDPDFRSRLNYRPDIDGLRALAVIPVVIFHAFPAVLPGGFVGVDIFFVISGFLITGIILQGLTQGTFHFAGFYANRIRRLFPALVVMLTACFAFGWFFLLPDEYAHLGRHMVGAVGYFENIVCWREAGYFDIRSTLKPLLHLWSLGVEEQFYLTYPLLLWLVWRFRRSPLAIVVSLLVGSFSLNVWQVRHNQVADFFSPLTRWWELMAGGAIACWQLLGRDPPLRRLSFDSSPNTLSCAGFLLIAIAVFRVREGVAFPGWWALLPVSGASWLIVAGPTAWINRTILASRAMVLVGLISYPLYLWHWPVLTLPRIIRRSELPIPARIVAVILSFGLAWATWRYVESPIRFGRKTWQKIFALVALSVVIGSLGFAASRDGFLRRFPDYAGDLGRPREVEWSTPDCRRMVGGEIDYCRVSTDAPPDVLLIGDSHAATLYAGLAPLYQKRSQVLMNLGKAGCVPFFDTETWPPGSGGADCKSVMNRILGFAASNPTARTIILSFRGPVYISGQAIGPEQSGPAKQIAWDGAPANATQSEVFRAALNNTIARLDAAGKNVILFLDWPELSFDPQTCMERPIQLFSAVRQFCGMSRTEVDARQHAYRDALFEQQTKFPRLRVFDSLPYLCDSAACYAMNAGHPFYSDSNHLSEAAVAYLSEKFVTEQFSRTAPPIAPLR